MRTILPQSFTVVFFPKKSIGVNEVFDLASKINQQIPLSDLKVNNAISLPAGIPAPFPLISAVLPLGWNMTVNVNRVDCVLQHFNLKNEEIPEDFYKVPSDLFASLASNFDINRIGVVGQFQDISDSVYKDVSNRFLVLFLKDEKAKFNSIGFHIKRDEEHLPIFDNFQIIRQEIIKNGTKADSFILIRDLNTGELTEKFTLEKVHVLFNIARKLLSMPSIKEEVYGK